VNDMQRDGFHQHGVQAGVAPYRPNSLDAGVPFPASEKAAAYVEVPAPVPASAKVRAAPVSFEDHFSQPRLFYHSMTPVEKNHIIQAYTFELAKCYEENVRRRQLQCLANIDASLCRAVAAGLGLEAPEPTIELPEVEPSPALSQIRGEFPVTGRVIGILADDSSDLATVSAAREAVQAADMLPLVVGPHGGQLANKNGTVPVQRTLLAAGSFEFDAVLVAGRIPPARDALPSLDAKSGDPSPAEQPFDPRVLLMLSEMFRHSKAIGVLAAAQDVLAAAGIPSDAAGVVVAESPPSAVQELAALVAKHRVWDRFPVDAD
jgi:catalase